VEFEIEMNQQKGTSRAVNVTGPNGAPPLITYFIWSLQLMMVKKLHPNLAFDELRNMTVFK